jgi:Protein of unknown function (DUF2844)
MSNIKKCITCRSRSALFALSLGLFLPGASQAGLGESADSAVRDHAALRGTALRRTPMANFEINEITTDDGTQVRAYVSRDGTVFAITWSGPALPDLKVVLGARYPQYGARAHAQPAINKALSITTDDLVLRVVKLPRGFAGTAHVPALLPPAFSAGDIR